MNALHVGLVDVDHALVSKSQHSYPQGWGPSSSEFRWAVGIENTFVAHTRRGHRRLDEYELMEHYRLWREDIDLAADLGISTIRYGIPWYKVNPRPGHFDWSWVDPVLEHLVERRGLIPIIDLMHYGTPLWLEKHFVDDSYPRYMAEFASRFAERYGSLVHTYTPINEPSVTANFCGRDGRWPPYLRGDDGYVKVLLSLMKGMNATAEALRASRSDTVLVHVEDIGLERPATPDMAGIASQIQARRLLPLDLACGKVVPGHPLFSWLMSHGATESELIELAESTPRWDVLGVNFYPWSNHRITRRRNGLPRELPDASPSALADVLRLAHERYNLPMMVTETSACGSPVERAIWMRETLSAVQKVREEGTPVIGYTWFPLFTMIEWKYRWSRRGMEHHLLHLGLYDVLNGAGKMDREPTALVEAYRRYVADPLHAIGAGPDEPAPSLVA